MMTRKERMMQIAYCLAADLEFRFDDHGEMTIDVFTDDREVPELSFLRHNNRWRVRGGYLCSSHTIASRVFEYQDNPPEELCRCMGQVWDLIGKVADTAGEKIRDIRIRHREQIASEANRGWQVPAFTAIRHREIDGEDKTYVYLMSHGNGLTKIGVSKYPEARERTLQAEDPRLNLLFAFEGDSSLERRIHKIFSCRRVRGEWFNLCERHVDWIRFLFGRGQPE